MAPKKISKGLRPYIEKKGTPRTIKLFTPLSRVDLSDLPAPQWADATTAAKPDTDPEKTAFGPIAFREDARATGLDFLYYSDAADPIEKSRLPETVGGGAGVIDFDGDGWPDLYLAQGSHKPVDPNQPTTRPWSRPRKPRRVTVSSGTPPRARVRGCHQPGRRAPDGLRTGGECRRRQQRRF
ncbi:MAG: hypothetical protein CM1200mP2_15970 [Planctomycetaceae bacterium]|nr:MAG: hypothetical protein CM1200mP2_15970 [Planctomycetaceae bacterium]